MGIVWIYNRQERAAGYWSLGFFTGATAGISVALRPFLQEFGHYTIAGHSVMLTAAYMLVWAGFRAFNGQKTSPLVILSVPFLWLVTFFLWQPLQVNPNAAIGVQSGIISLVSLSSAYILYNGRGNRDLPMGVPLTFFLATHAIFHAAHVWYAITEPSPIIHGRMAASWWKLLMLEAFLHTVLTSISCVILIKDRSEERHRIASETDALTGIANRRAFVNATEKSLEQANGSAALAIIDLDHFKQINDHHGHQAGDQTLIKFAALISKHKPESAIFGRMGGEEFGLFLPQSADEPEHILDELRRKVEAANIQYQGVRIKLTISIGMATVEKVGNGFDLLVAAADCALYIAKEGGRNRIVTFSPAQRLHKIIEKDGEKRIGLANERVSRKITRSGVPSSQ